MYNIRFRSDHLEIKMLNFTKNIEGVGVGVGGSALLFKVREGGGGARPRVVISSMRAHLDKYGIRHC